MTPTAAVRPSNTAQDRSALAGKSSRFGLNGISASIFRSRGGIYQRRIWRRWRQARRERPTPPAPLRAPQQQQRQQCAAAAPPSAAAAAATAANSVTQRQRSSGNG